MQFYSLLDRLEQRHGGKRTLGQCHGRMAWPNRGVYFFFEPGEARSDGGQGPRVVRVGTHALGAGSRTTLWNRLSQHRGTGRDGGGNHRGSIFRLIVGAALKQKQALDGPRSWGNGQDIGKAAARLAVDRDQLREEEQALERAVSAYIRSMPFLWLGIEDEPGPASLRGFIERNAIALLSGFDREPADPPSDDWLGHHSDRERVRRSGLWNSNHVDETHRTDFLAVFQTLIRGTRARSQRKPA